MPTHSTGDYELILDQIRWFAVVAVAQTPMERCIDTEGHHLDMAIAEDHIETARMGTAKSVLIRNAWRIAEGQPLSAAMIIVIEPRVHTLVVRPVAAGEISVRIEILFTDHICVTQPVGHMSGPDFAHLIRDTVRARLILEMPCLLGLDRLTATNKVIPFHAAVDRVIGTRDLGHLRRIDDRNLIGKYSRLPS